MIGDVDVDDLARLAAPPPFAALTKAQAASLQVDCPFVVTVTPVLTNVFQDAPIAEGWQYMLQIAG